MTAKELERIIASRGGAPGALDKVTRSLRDAFGKAGMFGLPTAGRGPNAYHLTGSEAAWMLIAYAGSDIATQAAHRLVSLAHLSGKHDVYQTGHSNFFMAAIQEMIEVPGHLDNVSSVRIAKNADLAEVWLSDGVVLTFGTPAPNRGYTSEGVYTVDLLRAIAVAYQTGGEAETGELVG